MTEPESTGLPELDALIVAHDAERDRLNRMIAVSGAESAVATAREPRWISVGSGAQGPHHCWSGPCPPVSRVRSSAVGPDSGRSPFRSVVGR